MRTKKILHGMILPAAVLSLLACGGGDGSRATDSVETDDAPPASSGNDEPLPEGVFESAHPGGVAATATSTAAGGMNAVGVTTPGAGTSNPAPAAQSAGQTDTTGPGGAVDGNGAVANGDAIISEGDDGMDAPSAARAIEEADIIKRDGDRLYALSTFGGLSVIDVSNPDNLKLLGRHRTTATPFEMYVRDGNVFVLYNGYPEYAFDEATETWTYYQTSYVMSLNASDPKAIKEDQRFEVEGYINDSRLVGDVMYVVAYDDANCYRCGTTAETNVMSLDVSDPNAITKADELTFPERQDEFGWKRSLSATDERLYIAGPRYGNGSEPDGSIVQVVDITDGTGDMQEGDAIEVAGQINSRWQMDEYDGVLRVISQPLWWVGGVPEVETFSIESSQELTALGHLSLVLPRPEELQAVRFDGTRAYAITFERTDPLFTIDLSEPETPLQMGELEMPGWVYHMEPRGDRVIGLGFDQGNAEGSLTVSIFDVSNLREPTMIDRVNFGGDWASLAEDQDRIHKSFQVLDDRELILVPFSGYDYSRTTGDECSGSATYVSGVQLIDWADDSLDLRGIAPSKGQARRAFFVDDRLLAMSDERLEAFDVSDRDAPTGTSRVELAQIVSQVAAVGDNIVRIGNDWWSSELEATVSSLDELLAYEPGVQVNLADLNEYTCYSQSSLSNVMSGGDNAYFLYYHYDWSDNRNDNQEMRVRILDVSDPNAPKERGDANLGFVPNYGRTYIPGMVDNGSASLAVGDALVFAQHDTEYNNLGFVVRSGYTLEVVDFTDADEPKKNSVSLPDSLGSTGLLLSGDVVATSHFETSPTNAQNVRFYIDRVDLSDPGAPELLGSVNIPGSLVAYDHASSRALTIDYQYVRINDISPQQCYDEEFGEFVTNDRSMVNYYDGRGQCDALRYKLNLVEVGDDEASLIDSYAVPNGKAITSASVGDDRIFLGTGVATTGYGGYGAPVPATTMPGVSMGPAIGIVGGGFWIPYYHYPFQTTEAELLVASGFESGELEVASVVVDTTNNFYGFNGLLAKGKKAVVATGWQGKLSVIDASDASDPFVFDSAELGGSASDMDLVGNTVVVALGQNGVQTIELND